VDDLKSLMRRFVDEFPSKGDEAVADELLGGHRQKSHRATRDVPGQAGREGLLRRVPARRPDLYAQVHDMLADGDKVVTRKTFHGTHTGEFMGLPPTGNAISVDVIDIVRVRDEKFVER
jgi:predicted ester cyclase